MKERKTFYTMMEQLENVHLIKDVGMIPYVMYRECGYDSYIVSYGKTVEEFEYLKTDVKGLKFAIRKKYTGNSIIDGCIWLVRNAKKIDVLHLFHYKYSTFIWILFYKIFHQSGQVYLKLDIDTDAGIHMKMKPHTLKNLATKWILGMCRVVSCETEYFCEHADKYWPIRVEYIPNGVLKKDILPKDEKKKIIMTVGRLGTKQKATEVLIEAYEKACPNLSSEWELVLVGTMTGEFERYIQQKTDGNESLKSRIRIVGEIKERKELEKLYQECSIFTMPSQWESFGIVALEALAKGDFLLLTDIASFRELTLDYEYGETFEIDNVGEYSEKLVDVCKRVDSGELDIECDRLNEVLKEKFAWESICKKLDCLLTKN